MTESVSKSVSNKVNKFRLEKNITQENLAESVGVTRQTVISIEKGSYTPSVLLALKIAKFFGRKVEDIFFIES